MPHARFIAFPELGHWPQISAPEVFRKVLDWLWETRAEAKRISAIVVPRKRATASFGPDAVGGTAARITRRFRGRPAQFQSACPIRRRSVLTQINRPIQRRSGGVSYGAAYSGPIGVIIASATSLRPGATSRCRLPLRSALLCVDKEACRAGTSTHSTRPRCDGWKAGDPRHAYYR
jgi:hypothetical protein